MWWKWYMLTCIHGYWNQTKFPKHKVCWLREAAQIGQTFIPSLWKRCLKHSTAEFQSIEQFWLLIGIVFLPKNKTKTKNEETCSVTINKRLFPAWSFLHVFKFLQVYFNVEIDLWKCYAGCQRPHVHRTTHRIFSSRIVRCQSTAVLPRPWWRCGHPVGQPRPCGEWSAGWCGHSGVSVGGPRWSDGPRGPYQRWAHPASQSVNWCKFPPYKWNEFWLMYMLSVRDSRCIARVLPAISKYFFSSFEHFKIRYFTAVRRLV